MDALSPPAAKALADRVARILGPMRQAVAASRLARHPCLAPLAHLLWATIGRAMARFARYAEWAAAGRPAPSRAPTRVPSPRHLPPTTPTGPHPGTPRRRLPEGFAWLLPFVPGVGNFGSQLRHLMLTDPDMVALLRAVPEAATLFRPILRMLGTEPGLELADLLPRRVRPARRAPPACHAPADIGHRPADTGPPPPDLVPPDLVSPSWGLVRAPG